MNKGSPPGIGRQPQPDGRPAGDHVGTMASSAPAAAEPAPDGTGAAIPAASVLESISEGVIVLDREWRIVFVNAAAEGFTRQPRAAMVGRRFWDLFPDTGGYRCPGEYRRAMADNVPVHFEELLSTPEDCWFEIRAYPSPERLSIFVRDVTERRQAQEELRRSEERYWSLFSSMAQGMAVLEIIRGEDGTPEDFRFLEVNPAYERMAGRTRDQLVGRLRNEVFPGGHAHWVAAYREIARTGGPITVDYRSPAIGRDYDAVVYSPGPGQIAVVFHDITERKRLEVEQRVLLAKYQTLFDAFPVGISVTDSAGKVVEVNHTASRLLGTPAPSLQTHRVGSPQWHIVRPDGSPMPPDELASVRAMKEQRVVEDVETGIVRPGEPEVWVSVSAAPIPLEGYGVVITYGDVSRRIQAERALAASQASLSRANEELLASNEALRRSNETLEARVAARTAELSARTAQLQALALDLTRAEERERQRVAGVIHDDIQQLLSVARMSLGSALQRVDDATIRESLADADGLIAASLNITRTLTAELSPAILHRSGLTAALRWMGRWYHERLGLEVTVEAGDDAGADLAEETRVTLFRAVRELLFNVVKHARASSARVSFSRTADGRAQVVVSDEGIGFDPGTLRAPDEHNGSFGIFSLRERLNLLGGRLDVDSVPGHGTSFTVTGPPPGPAPIDTPASAAPGADQKPARARPRARLSRPSRRRTR